jgi:hypothetical protein
VSLYKFIILIYHNKLGISFSSKRKKEKRGWGGGGGGGGELFCKWIDLVVSWHFQV